MDPYISPDIILNSSPHNPFNPSTLNTIDPLKGSLKETHNPFPTFPKP